MESFVTVLPIFLVVAAGYLFRKMNIAKDGWVGPLNGFVYYIALPSLIVLNLSKLDWQSSDVAKVAGVNIVFLLILSVVAYGVTRLSVRDKKLQAVLFLTAVVSNSVYLGLPIAMRAFNLQDSSQEYAFLSLVSVVQLVFGMLVALIAIEFLYVGKKDTKSIIRHIGTNPLVIAVAVGVVFSFITLPEQSDQVFEHTLGLLAATASPLALFALGDFLSKHRASKNLRLIGLATVLKLVVAPLIAWFVFDTMFELEHSIVQDSLLLSAMPTAVTAFVIAEKYKLDTAFAALVMLVTTVIGLFSASVIISLVA